MKLNDSMRRSYQDQPNLMRLSHILDPEQKLHGFPKFIEPTPNLQTRNPATQTVMEKALHRFE